MKTPIASLVALALAAGTFAASASIPDSKGVIHACHRKSDGRLRVIDTQKGRKCRKSERPVEWNERGRRGRVGPEGDRGPRGRRGPQGEPGPPGGGFPITEHLTGSSEVTQVAAGAEPITHTVSWTVPDDTIARAYFRVSVTTPSGACESESEASWTFSLEAIASGNASSESFNGTIYPGTTLLPAAGGYSFGNERALLPGDYSITTRITRAEFVAACENALVETEVFVVTEASAA
jgi:hypothetical protein